MAVPFDNATTLLTTGANALRTVYHDKFNKMHNRFGSKTNRFFKPSKRRIDGDGITIQVSDTNMYGARTDTDINADFPTPRAFGTNSYRVNLSETAGSNHMRRMALSLQVTHMDLKRARSSEAAAVNWVQELVRQSMQNVAESTAIHRHLDSTSKIATLNGTPASNDNRLFASCAAIGTTGGARCPIDGGSIAAVPSGLVLETRTGSTLDYYVQVTDYNPRDTSVGLYGLVGNVATGAASADVNINGLADNDDLYISGEYNKNILSLGHWFSDPSSGDSFFTRDRTSPLYRWLLPHKAGPTSATQFTKSHLDDAAVQMGYIEEESEGGYVMLMTPELEQRYRNEIGNDIIIQFPTDEQRGKLIAQYGFDGGMYRHPHLGRVVLQSDPLCPANKIYGLRVGDWETLYAPTEGGENGFEWLPGGDMDGWYRMPSSTAGNGNTTTYRMDGMLLMCDICLSPRSQFQIINVTA
jgi:hypothetical protein